MNFITFVSKDNKELKISEDTASEIFSKDKNKQWCFKQFLYENKQQWCMNNISYSDIIRYKQIQKED